MIGPDKTYPLGAPLNPHDQGGLNVAFTTVKQRRLGLMHFGTSVSWLASGPAEMTILARTIRQRIIKDFGRLRYNKQELPIHVVTNQEHRVIELYLPQQMEVLAANPEMWLALAEVIEDNIKKLKLH